ncbi:peptide chain release factor N(5)-glutamine methyltransferase [Sphaerotilus sp.]|uniref:peptide chain release factor N(5)-glutamine methyltransferase n=1 Tax=Sphaerotilus sp. TaxID=2093942 RepID=UPI0034E1A2FE
MNVAAALALARTLGLPRVDADVLLGALLDRSRTWLLTHDDTPLDATQQARWRDWLTRRADGVPVAYLTGQHEFHGLMLHVTPDVLDPRPDTETLVDWALEMLAARAPGASVADLGTGSGAVALALAHRRPDAQVSAVDLSPAALAVAQANGERLGLPVRWRLGAWFAPLAGERFDLVVSNPPYIAESDAHLPALRHEPALALTSGTDGLDAIRQLIADAPAYLEPDGWLLLEHGHDQGPTVAALLTRAGWRGADRRDDLASRWRCTGAMRPAA